MNRTFFSRIAAVLCTVMMIAVPAVVLAEEEPGQSEVSFAIRPLIPDNQRDGGQAYFDLLLGPGDTQTVQVEIRNTGEEDKVIVTEVSTATTNMNGVVSYARREEGYRADETLVHHIEDIVKAKGEVEVAAGETCVLDIEIKMPSEQFEGVLAGGLVFREKEAGSVTEQEIDEEAGVLILNKYQYAVAMLLRNSETEVSSEMVLNDVYAGQKNSKNVIYSNLQNTEAKFMNRVAVKAEVTKQGAAEVLYSHEAEEMQMAPHSNFDFTLPLNGEAFVAGNYLMTLYVESKGETWVLQQEFTITREEARALNASDVTITGLPMWVYVTVGAGCLLLVMMIVMIVRRAGKAKRERRRFEEEMRAAMHKRTG